MKGDMLRALIYGLAILHLGPGAAFAVLAFGCDPSSQWLGSACQQDTLKLFLGLTLGFWLIPTLGAVAAFVTRRRAAEAP
jgi:hypothetical protein